MLAVPLFVMVAPTRRGRLVVLIVLCVMVSAIRSTYHHDGSHGDSYVALGRWDWNEENEPDSFRIQQQQEYSNDPVKRSIFWNTVQQWMPRRQRTSMAAAESYYKAHLSTVVSPEEVAHHLRHSQTSSRQQQQSWLSRVWRPRRSTLKDATVEVMPVMEESSLESSSSTLSSSLAPSEDVIHQSLTEPLMLQSVWNSLTGTEFQTHSELIDGLASMGERLVRSSADADNGWIVWTPYGKHPAVFDERDDETIQVWTGKAKRTTAGPYHGADIPFIRSKSRIPMSPVELKDLMLDSTRIKTYNPWSTGRQDCWIREATALSEQSLSKQQRRAQLAKDDDRITKIVKNKVQPPVGSALVGVTMLHARPLLEQPGAWLVVSRSVGGQAYFDAQDVSSAGRSDILLGVNLIEPASDDPDNACIMTTITHAASSSIPSMLAERFGVKGAVKYVQDIRKLKVPV